jgi:hypothetical protein
MNYIRLGRGDVAALADDRATAPRFYAELGAQGSATEGLAAVRRWYDAITKPNHNEHMVAAAWAAHYGDTELALRAAAGATEVRAHNVWFLWLPLFDEVRRSDGFEQLIVELGLLEFWRETQWPRACRAVGAADFTCE